MFVVALHLRNHPHTNNFPGLNLDDAKCDNKAGELVVDGGEEKACWYGYPHLQFCFYLC